MSTMTGSELERRELSLKSVHPLILGATQPGVGRGRKWRGGGGGKPTIAVDHASKVTFRLCGRPCPEVSSERGKGWVGGGGSRGWHSSGSSFNLHTIFTYGAFSMAFLSSGLYIDDLHKLG